MTPIEAAAGFALCVLPLYWLVQRELDRISDPAYLRTQGVVIVALRALEGHSRAIGTYLGCEIWESVTFQGGVYRFRRVVPRAQRERTGPGELYLEPGLIYALD